jgi:MFS family permease
MNAPTSQPIVGSKPLASAYSEWADPSFRRLLCVQMTYGYVFAALLIVPKYATTALLATPEEVGTLAASAGVAVTLAGLLLGRFLDGGGVRTSILLGAFILGTSTFAFASTSEIGPAAYFLRALHGVASALIMGGAAAYVVLLVPSSRHGRAFAVASTASLMMNAVGSTVTERLAAAFGWRTAFEFSGTVALAGAAMATTLPHLEGGEPVSRSPAADRKNLDLYGMLAGATAVGIGFGIISTFTQPYALSLGGSDVSSLFVGFTVTALVVRVGLASLIDRVSRKSSALFSLVLYAVATAWAAVLRPESLFLLGLMFGAAHGLAWPSLSALVVERAPRGYAPSSLSRLYALFSAGALVAVWTGGRLVEGFGYATTFLVATAAVVGCAVLLGIGVRAADPRAG